MFNFKWGFSQVFDTSRVKVYIVKGVKLTNIWNPNIFDISGAFFILNLSILVLFESQRLWFASWNSVKLLLMCNRVSDQSKLHRDDMDDTLLFTRSFTSNVWKLFNIRKVIKIMSWDHDEWSRFDATLSNLAPNIFLLRARFDDLSEISNNVLWYIEFIYKNWIIADYSEIS